jgi:mono/diheme cytochrome c family protein
MGSKQRWGLLWLLLGQGGWAQSPDTASLSSLSGAQVFEQLCSRCHGPDGKGNIAPEVREGMEVPPRDLTDPYFNTREKRSDWIRVVRDGGEAGGLSSSMPAWGEVLSEQQIREVVEYVKAFVDQRRYPAGELNFIRMHRVTKAFVEQEALLISEYTRNPGNVAGRNEQLLFYYANRFGNRFQYEVKVPFEINSIGGRSNAGLGDLELGLKYALFDDYRKQVITSVGFELAVPTGSESKNLGNGAFIAIPYFAAGLGVGRWAQLQGFTSAEVPLKSARTTEWRYAAAAVLTLPDGKQGLFPGFEVFGIKPLGEAGNTFAVLPNLYWAITKLGHVALSAGVEIPVTSKAGYDWRVHGFLLWDYADGGLFW